MASSASRPGRFPRTRGGATALAVVVLTVLAARARTFGNPVLGFDEQFYLLVGDRMLHGALPYVDVFDRKPVGLFLIYAASRLLGGDGFLQYQLVASGFVAGTALVLAAEARRLGGGAWSLLGAVLYVLWLDLLEGDGGQAEVLHALPMTAAAAVVARTWSRRDLTTCDLAARGAGAMTLVGIAIQIKYLVVPEGILFGCFLLAAAWRTGLRGAPLAASAAVWIGFALLPTVLALGYYEAVGHGREFVFANFVSGLGQARSPLGDRVGGAALMLAVLAPLLWLLGSGLGGRPADASDHAGGADLRFHLAWAAVATASVVLYGRFASPHYAIPVLPPLCVLIGSSAPRSRRARDASLAVCALGFVAGQAVIALNERWKGGAEVAAEVARAARPVHGGIYVFDGFPALYMLTGSRLPTRWAFPGHLDTAEEDDPRALGVDPAAEVRRIMAARPDAVVDDWPVFAGTNRRTRVVLSRALARDYVLAAIVRTPGGRRRLVYRRKAGPGDDGINRREGAGRGEPTWRLTELRVGRLPDRWNGRRREVRTPAVRPVIRLARAPVPGHRKTYVDLPHHIGHAQTISDPFVVTAMTAALELRADR